ncbi:Solute-binding protein family 3/N-terminal domain of MltF [Burkholderiales bacterium]
MSALTPASTAYDPSQRSALAPTGLLRASINLGNAVLAGRDGSGAPMGVTVDLAREFGRQLGLEVSLQAYDKAMESVEAVSSGKADIGFFAIDPKRGETILFTPPYVLIEGCYLVRDSSPLRHQSEADQAGHRIVVGQGSAYDLYLTRAIQQATLVRAQTSQTVVDEFVASGAEIAAGVREQLALDCQRVEGLRFLDEPFMVIEQAMGCAKVRGAVAQSALSQFVEWAKASGFVEQALLRHGQTGARVAPPAQRG